jgi:hypothetical protein
VIFSRLHIIFKNIEILRILNAAIFAITFSVLIFIYCRIFTINFCVLLFITVVFSPWMMPIAKNLYWMPVLWLLPALFTSIYYYSASQLCKILSISIIYFCFTIKCLAQLPYFGRCRWWKSAEMLGFWRAVFKCGAK